jgi:simple sugar transport system permease protein
MRNEGQNAFMRIIRALMANKVVLLFAVLTIVGVATANKPLPFIVGEVFTRFGRNTFLVLALIIPVIAGLGLNFGLVVGAMAAQLAIFIVVYFGFTGVKGLALCFLICTPVAILFGYLVGKLFNKTKGAEMITGMVVAYFADGLYQFVFLFLIGGVIPVNNPTLIIDGGVGVKNTIDLANNLKYSMDNISMLQVVRVLGAVIVVALLVVAVIQRKSMDRQKGIVLLLRGLSVATLVGLSFVPPVTAFMDSEKLLLQKAVYLGCGATVIVACYGLVKAKFIDGERPDVARFVKHCLLAAAVFGLSFVPTITKVLRFVSVPVCTLMAIGLVCVFNQWILTTKLGQDMRTVGQSRVVANAAGINVNRTRIIAMIFSTVLASWGQLIYLQNMGTFATYGAHTMTAVYSIAALVVGGASVQSANNKHALLGVVMFHTLFVVMPHSATNLFGSALIGEYFRVFICYGTIAVSLAMHAWKAVAKHKEGRQDDGNDNAAVALNAAANEAE